MKDSKNTNDRRLHVVVACPVIIHLWSGSEELSQALRAINEAHTGEPEIAMDETTTEEHLEAHARLCRHRKATIDVEVCKNGGIIPRFMTFDGLRYRMVQDP